MSFKILKFVIRNPSGSSAVSLLGWQQPFERSPPKISWRVLLDLFCRYVLDFYSECPPTTPILARSRFQNAGLSSAADVCSRPATPRNRTRWRVERFSFSFSDKLAFHGNRTPNTRPVQTQLQEWPFFFSAFLHTTLLLSIFVFLSLSPPRVACSRVGWFSRALAFRLLYYPWGKMGDYS